MEKISPEKVIFALDIGTRTVIGLAALPENGRLRVLAQKLVEHRRRAMLDGQIHDIPSVAEAVKEVRRNLEDRLGFPLRQVAIAAAGRSLVTRACHVELESGGREIDWAEVNALELAAVQQAHRELAEDLASGAGDFTCVGYSIVSYYLDGYAISSLVGHRGKVIGADVLATFLPGSVVNSLYAVLQRAGLEPLSLTLEPIAAIEAAIPESYRLLNLALVDIGAGTSDIAITRDGAVTAYGMVPVAGDEVTEEIVQACLVDFDTAERMKRELSRKEEIRYVDILGAENSILSRELLARLDPVLERLAARVAAQILALNSGRPPRSVFCVGGGSQVPGLTEKIARHLQLEKNRVVLRDRRSLGQLLMAEEDEITGPEGITVVGIALNALRRMGHDFIHVVVNGEEHRLFNVREFTVGNVLALTGFNPRLLIGQNGRNLVFTLNGRRRVIYGGLSQPARILVNGREANLKTRVAHGDRIDVYPAQNGADARLTVAELFSPPGHITVEINGQATAVPACCLVNGEQAEGSREITDGAKVEVFSAKPLQEWLAEHLGGGIPAPPHRLKLLVNGEPAPPVYYLRPGDRVVWEVEEGGAANREKEGSITVTVNGLPVNLRGQGDFLLLDVFKYISLDPASLAPPVKILLNGCEAGFTDPLKDGDVIEIKSGA
ncbi:cell division protein FtsA [Desulfovirgula thermocuniculi]|uniref:cell division protein FtsA n=1 Tax=Desulfovirgula thermocuniculi TaxID=348842 RepID=UPI0004183AF9|nr:cell division protein FtsA [Desulfovirgula thermocuniculi]